MRRSLRVAEPEMDAAAAKGHPSPESADQGRFAGPIRAEDRPVLIRFDLPEAILQDQLVLKTNRNVIESDEMLDHKIKKAPSSFNMSQGAAGIRY